MINDVDTSPIVSCRQVIRADIGMYNIDFFSDHGMVARDACGNAS